MRDDTDHYRTRSQEERSRATSSSDHVAALAHTRMADEYDRRIAQVAAVDRIHHGVG